jgi:hypothetical protein
MQLMVALVDHYQPNGFKLLVKQSVDAALAQQALPKPKPTKNRFKRRSPVPPAFKPGADAIRRDSSGDPASPAASLPAQPTPALQPPLNAKPDNVVVLPGTRTPFGLRYGIAEDLPKQPASKGNGSIHPDVVRRSADPLAYDSAYSVCKIPPWRR